MRHLFSLLLAICSFFPAHAQLRFYSISNGDWTNPITWSTQGSGIATSASVPGPTDEVIIRHHLQWTGDQSLSLQGKLSVDATGWLEIITGSGANEGFFFKGNEVLIRGKLTTTGDFYFSGNSPDEAGTFFFAKNARVSIGDDFILQGKSNIVLEQAPTTAFYLGDDLLFWGEDVRVSGEGSLIVKDQIMAQDANGETKGALASPADQSSKGIAYFSNENDRTKAISKLVGAGAASETLSSATEWSSVALQVYPNPFSEEALTINLAGIPAGEMLTLEVVDIAGRVLLQRTALANPAGEINETWPLELSHGTYLLHARAAQMQVSTVLIRH